jgi:hypothetical protein
MLYIHIYITNLLVQMAEDDQNGEDYTKKDDDLIEDDEEKFDQKTVIDEIRRRLATGIKVKRCEDECHIIVPESDDEDIPKCRFGAICRDITNPIHCGQFMHPTIVCQWDKTCKRKDDLEHCKRFIHT